MYFDDGVRKIGMSDFIKIRFKKFVVSGSILAGITVQQNVLTMKELFHSIFTRLKCSYCGLYLLIVFH